MIYSNNKYNIFPFVEGAGGEKVQVDRSTRRGQGA